jgi:hypothetical protein
MNPTDVDPIDGDSNDEPADPAAAAADGLVVNDNPFNPNEEDESSDCLNRREDDEEERRRGLSDSDDDEDGRPRTTSTALEAKKFVLSSVCDLKRRFLLH